MLRTVIASQRDGHRSPQVKGPSRGLNGNRKDELAAEKDYGELDWKNFLDSAHLTSLNTAHAIESGEVTALGSLVEGPLRCPSSPGPWRDKQP